jgi:hypothetical protein
LSHGSKKSFAISLWRPARAGLSSYRRIPT